MELQEPLDTHVNFKILLYFTIKKTSEKFTLSIVLINLK